MFWGDGGTAHLSVHLIEGRRQLRQGPVHNGLNLPDGMILRGQLVWGRGTGIRACFSAWPPAGDTWSVANDAPGITEAVQRLAQLHPKLVVLEAPGGLQMPVAAALCPRWWWCQCSPSGF
jgi:hypothetical protein